MPRPALTEEQRQETRRRIREAATGLFVERGIGEISARSIAERAGVSVGTLYTHFGNLTELMQSLWKIPVARLLTRMDTIAERHEDPIERLRALLTAYVSFAQEHKAVYRGAFLFVRPESLEKPKRVGVEQNHFHRLFATAIREGQEAGAIRAGDASLLAQFAWSSLHGAIALPMNLDNTAFASAKRLNSQAIDYIMEFLLLNREG